jgi:hypothetical protein
VSPHSSWAKRSRPPSALQALSQIQQFTDKEEDAASVATTVPLATALMEFVCARHIYIAIPDSRGTARHRIWHAFTRFITFLTSATQCSPRGGTFAPHVHACQFPHSCGLPLLPQIFGTLQRASAAVPHSSHLQALAFVIVTSRSGSTLTLERTKKA